MHNAYAKEFDMNWDDLKVILAISRTGTMSGAAKQLKVQHSTISRRIKSLEKQLGTNLIRRNKGAYVLTQAGSKIKQTALQVEKEIMGIDGSLLSKNDPLFGPIRVSTINSLASTILMPIFSAFSKAHPQIDLHVMVSNETVSLANREADLAIRLSNTPPENLIGKRIAGIASTVYGSSNYLNKVKSSDEKITWLGVSCCGYHITWTKESCDTVTNTFNSDDAILTLAALKQDLGVAYLFCCVGDNEPELERVYAPQPKHDLGMWLLIHPEAKYNARVLAFREFLIHELEKRKDELKGYIQ